MCRIQRAVPVHRNIAIISFFSNYINCIICHLQNSFFSFDHSVGYHFTGEMTAFLPVCLSLTFLEENLLLIGSYHNILPFFFFKFGILFYFYSRHHRSRQLDVFGSLNPILILYCCHFFNVLGPHLLHMDSPRLEIESKLQLLPYTTATAAQDPSCVSDPHHSSRHRRILHPQSEARD